MAYELIAAVDLGSNSFRLQVGRIVANQIFIDWKWDGLSSYVDMLEVQVDRGAGWQVLVFDTTPGYTDTMPFPASPTKWKYRAIWRLDDQQVGQWSEEKSINVG